MKTRHDHTPTERLLRKIIQHAPHPLTLAEIVAETGYSSSHHIKICLRYLTASGLIAERTGPTPEGKDAVLVYCLP